MADLDVDGLAAKTAASPDRKRPPSAIRPIVLVGDDDADIQDAVSELLTTAGYDVVRADDGLEMAALLDGGLRPTVILLDLMMPRVNGHDFLAWRAVRPNIRRIPVVVCSASAFNEVLVRTQMIAALLVKPTTSQDLLSAISQAARMGTKADEAGPHWSEPELGRD